MRIAFLSSGSPFPPDNGVRIPLYHSIRAMSDAGHRICLLCFENPGELHCIDRMKDSLPGVDVKVVPYRMKGRLRLLATAILQRRPALMFLDRFRSKPYSLALRELLAQFKPDIVHFDLLPMTQYLDKFPSNIATVASINDSLAFELESRILDKNNSAFRRRLLRLQLRAARRFESRTLGRFDTVHVVSKADARYLTSLSPQIKCKVIPNGVADPIFSLGLRNRGNKSLVFVAHLTGGNLDAINAFLDRVWLRNKKELAGAKLRIFGRLGTDGESLVKRVEKLDGVSLEGYVENIESAYCDAGISIVPINKSSGLVNKAAEGMAAGHAVVGYESAFAGLDCARIGENVVGVKDDAQFGAHLCKLLNDQALLRRFQRQAHSSALDNLGWNNVYESYKDMYEDALQSAYLR